MYVCMCVCVCVFMYVCMSVTSFAIIINIYFYLFSLFCHSLCILPSQEFMKCVCVCVFIVTSCSGCVCSHALRLLAAGQRVSGVCVCGALVEMTVAGDVKVCVTGGATESALFFPPFLPPAVQSIQLLSPRGSRQSITASGCILLTCAAPLMNSQHDPG